MALPMRCSTEGSVSSAGLPRRSNCRRPSASSRVILFAGLLLAPPCDCRWPLTRHVRCTPQGNSRPGSKFRYSVGSLTNRCSLELNQGGGCFRAGRRGWDGTASSRADCRLGLPRFLAWSGRVHSAARRPCAAVSNALQISAPPVVSLSIDEANGRARALQEASVVWLR